MRTILSGLSLSALLAASTPAYSQAHSQAHSQAGAQTGVQADVQTGVQAGPQTDREDPGPPPSINITTNPPEITKINPHSPTNNISGIPPEIPSAALDFTAAPIAPAAKPVFQQIPIAEKVIRSNNSSLFYDMLGSWLVGIDFSPSAACFATSAYQNQAALSIRSDTVAGGFMLIISSRYWLSLRDGETRPLALSMDGRDPGWLDPATTVTNASTRSIAPSITTAPITTVHSLALPIRSQKFLDELIVAKQVTLRSDDVHLGHYQLGAIEDALKALTECQTFIDNWADPFAD